MIDCVCMLMWPWRTHLLVLKCAAKLCPVSSLEHVISLANDELVVYSRHSGGVGRRGCPSCSLEQRGVHLPSPFAPRIIGANPEGHSSQSLSELSEFDWSCACAMPCSSPFLSLPLASSDDELSLFARLGNR